MDCNLRILQEHKRMFLDRDDPLFLERGSSKGWALHLRRVFPMLKQTLDRARKVFNAMDPGVKWTEEGMVATFTSGYKYEFGHCQKPGDWEKYQSNQYDWIGFDELTQFEKEQYEQIKTRLRSSDPLLMRMLYARSMSNPLMRREAGEDFVVRDPHWVRRYFVDPDRRGRKEIKRKLVRASGDVVYESRIYLPAALYDNPDKDYVAQYEKRLLGAPPHIRAAMLYGDWYVTPDSFFGRHWNQRIHVCAPFKIPSSWPVFRSMDWGFKSQGVCHWYAMDPDGTLYVIYELNFRLKYADEVADMIIDVEKKLGLPVKYGSALTGPADDQLWEDKGDTGVSKAATMALKGVRWVKANKKRRRRNAELVVKRLVDHENGTVVPGLVVFENCRRLIETLPAIGTDTKDSENPADGGEDHWADSLMYGTEFASRERPTVERDETDDWGEPEPEASTAHNYTSYGYYR